MTNHLLRIIHRSFLLALLLFSPVLLAGTPSPSVTGHWFFYKKIYQKQEMPEPPDASLRMHFEFTDEGQSLLYWWHEGENDFCRRHGEYFLTEGVIVDKVTWVDPENSRECGSDPDMQLGRITRTPYYFHNGDLAIRFHLGDEPLDLVWKKIEGEGK